MAIKDKDGSILKLRGPNPVMRVQDRWDFDTITTENFRPDEQIVLRDDRKRSESVDSEFVPRDIGEELELTDKTTDDRFVSAEQFLGELDEQNEAATPVEPDLRPPTTPTETATTPTPLPDRTARRLIAENTTTIWCAPVVETEFKDDLYGERRIRRSYGQKVLLEGIIVSESDSEMIFWSEPLCGNGSIVYPQNRSKRWWRVESSETKTGGHLHRTIFSDVNPDFS